MGGIDLDPASCAEANNVVRATRFFTASDNGLDQEWSGRIWLNPPYNKGMLRRFMLKLVTELDSQHVTSAVALAPFTVNAWCRAIGNRVTTLLALANGTQHWGPNPARMGPMPHFLWVFGTFDTSPLETLPCVTLVADVRPNEGLPF